MDRLRQRHRLWARPAAAPEDYVHEHIPCPWAARMARRLLTRLVVLAILGATAVAVTQLSALSVQEGQNVAWQPAAMAGDVAAASAGLALPGSTANASTTAGYNATLELIRAASNFSSSSSSSSPADAAAAFCGVLLPGACAPAFGSAAGVAAGGLNMTFGELLQWASPAEALVKQRPLLANMTQCAQEADGGEGDGGVEACSAAARRQLATQACLACYCLGLSGQDTDAQPAGWVGAVQAQCAPYVDDWDVRSLGVRVAIALVIAAINFALKLVVEVRGAVCVCCGAARRSPRQ